MSTSKAQQTRGNFYSKDYGKRGEYYKLGQDYFDMVLDLIDRLARTRVVDEEVVIKFHPYYGGKVNVSITPQFGYPIDNTVPTDGNLEKKFEIEGFKIMKKMFVPEEGFDVDIGYMNCPDAYSEGKIYCVTVTMFPPEKDSTQECG